MSELDIAFGTAITDAVANAMRPYLERLEHLIGRQAPPVRAKRMLTIPDMVAEYGIGRRELQKLITAGKLKAVSRIARGGHESWVVERAEAEKVLAGVHQ
jgi:hypothetical protein